MHKFLTAALVLALFISCGVNYAMYRHMHRSLERKIYETLSPPGGPFSHAVRHGNTLYLSGLTAHGTPAQGKNMAEQAEAIWDQIGTIAQAEGTDLGSLIKVTMFITDFSQAPQLRNVLISRYGGQLPASSLVEVSGLFSPDANIEIEAVLGL